MSSPTGHNEPDQGGPAHGRRPADLIASPPPWALEAFRRMPVSGQRATRRVVQRVAVGGRIPVRWGGLRRTSPVNRYYGYGRGTPIDRWFMRRFVGSHVDDIRGDVLEVQTDEWTTQYAGSPVSRLDILDLDATNPEATVIANLSDADSLGRSRYDCVLVMQTLQYVDDPVTAVRTLASSLRPGGVALLTVPTVSQLDLTCGADGDKWRFTVAGMRSLLAQAGLAGRADVFAYGNVLVATAFLHGIAAEELRDEELLEVDDRYPVLVCARITG